MAIINWLNYWFKQYIYIYSRTCLAWGRITDGNITLMMFTNPFLSPSILFWQSMYTTSSLLLYVCRQVLQVFYKTFTSIIFFLWPPIIIVFPEYNRINAHIITYVTLYHIKGRDSLVSVDMVSGPVTVCWWMVSYPPFYFLYRSFNKTYIYKPTYIRKNIPDYTREKKYIAPNGQ